MNGDGQIKGTLTVDHKAFQSIDISDGILDSLDIDCGRLTITILAAKFSLRETLDPKGEEGEQHERTKIQKQT